MGSFAQRGLIGFSYRFPRLAPGTDVSHGIFLYHMIIVNVFIQRGWVGSWAAAAAVIAITLILAYVSTVTAGRWSRKKKAAWEKAA